jgi:FemAB-related protein (PEP-CTERM system-associated)
MIIKWAEDADQKRWDEFILNHPNASPYHLFAWRKTIAAAYKHKCIYLYAAKNEEILGVLPLVHLHFPAIINEMVSLPFCDVGSCIVANEEAQDLLLKEAIHYPEKNKTKKFQVRGNLIPTDSVQSNFQSRRTGKVRMFLDLPASSDELFKSFKSKLRSQVRKAEKNGVNFFWGGVEDIDSAYRVFSKNMHELGSPVHSKSFLKAVLTWYGARAKLGLAEFQGKIIGMGIILLGGKGVCIPWASTLREYNRLGPNMMLYWNFLKYSADKGYAFFDFGRSSEGEGTYKFKKQWGAKPTPLVWYDTIEKRKTKTEPSRNGTGKRERVAAIWQKLPLGFANMIGPHLRKYISL